VVPSTRTSDIVVIRELAAEVEHQFQVTASLVVQGEMYKSRKSILTQIVICKGYVNLHVYVPICGWGSYLISEFSDN